MPSRNNTADAPICPPPPTTPAAQFEKAGELLRQFVEGFTALSKAVVTGLGHLAIYTKRSELIEQAGWLPHPAAPFDIIPFDQDAATVSNILREHYTSNWAKIKEQFSNQIELYEIDWEAKATYREALELHQLGYYQAVVRLLFPEIERVACKEVYLGDQYERRADGKKDGLITSLRSLRTSAGQSLGLKEMGDVRYSLSLFQRMSDHLYEKIGNEKTAIEKYELDLVPNRHAALHGIVIYKSLENSINTLIMTEFMFGVIDALKKNGNSDQT